MSLLTTRYIPLVRAMLLVMLVALTLLATAHAETPATAQLQVQQSVDKVLTVLRNGSLSAAQKRDQLTPLIDELFDFKAMAQGALATRWKKATSPERRAFTERFSRLLTLTYTSKVDNYRDETVEILKSTGDNRRAVVDTSIHTSTVDIPITYKLRHKDNRWQVYDVIIENVSLVRNYRSSYGEIVRRHGMEALLTRMDRKIATLTPPQDETANTDTQPTPQSTTAADTGAL